MSFFTGQKIYKYELIKKLGQGQFGEVWLAKDIILDKEVAIKLLLSAVLDETFLNEARNGFRFSHQNLVRVHYADIVNDVFPVISIIAQDFHERGSIINQLNSCNFLPIKETIKYIKDILYGLEYLHEYKLLHNDIKPSNILISNSLNAILADYGISSTYSTDYGAKSETFYRIHCAPETSRENHIQPQSDIYQVGCTIFRLVNGIGFIKDDFNRLGNIHQFNQLKEKGKIPNKKSYLPYIPIQLKKIINKAIEPDPAKRFQSALEMRRALERLRFIGDWTVNINKEPVGRCGEYNITYEITPKAKNSFSITTWKEHRTSKRKTRVTAYTKCSITQKQLKLLQDELIRDVITGDILSNRT